MIMNTRLNIMKVLIILLIAVVDVVAVSAQKRRVEEDGLTALVQGLADSREQPWREGSVHHLAAAQLLDVDDLHLRQLYILIALRQTYIAVLSSSGILV